MFEDVTALVTPQTQHSSSYLDPRVRALVVPEGAGRSRRWFEALREAVRAHAAELSWLLPGKRAQGFAHAELETVRSELSLAAGSNDAVIFRNRPTGSRCVRGAVLVAA